MIQGVSDITFENFQNPENTQDEIFEEMETEEFMNTATKATPPNNNSNSDSDSDSDSDMDEHDIENLDNANNIDSEESIIHEEDNNKKLKTTNPEYKKSKFANIEGFQGSQIQLYWNRNLLLKCILFGILFYVLSSPKTYALTNQYLPSNIDRVLLHSILYTFIIFVIYQII